MRDLSISLKDLPDVGAFGECKRKLEALNYRRDITINFAENVKGLGMSGHDHHRVDVYMFDGNGSPKGWTGCYGGSYAGMYASNGVGGSANLGNVNSPVPPEVVILEFRNAGTYRSATLYINPVHQTKMLGSGEELSKRLQLILSVFRSLKSFARPEELLRGNVTTEELQELCSKGFLKPQNGKMPNRNGNVYDLVGCRITTEGKNACRSIGNWFSWEREMEKSSS